MNLDTEITALEKTYKDLLESFFNSVYPAGRLISHGLDHHRRVWSFAKELIRCTCEEFSDPGVLTKLMIACYLHDIGMSVNPGVKHGSQSRIICEEFLRLNHLLKSEFNDVLQAIEFHDEKDYESNNQNENHILKILSAADDLDAFGYIGIYRYAEIYLLRGTDPADLGHIIQANASNRFRCFGEKFASYPSLVRRHQNRFEILDNFFNHYNRSIGGYHFGNRNPSGYCGIIEILIKNIIDTNVLSPYESDHIPNDKVIEAFFTELMNELI